MLTSEMTFAGVGGGAEESGEKRVAEEEMEAGKAEGVVRCAKKG